MASAIVERDNGLSERQAQIHRLLAERGTLRVDQLAQEMGVVTMTIRRDLAAMERRRLLIRTHGGCILQSTLVAELSFREKQASRAAQKAAIATRVVRQLQYGQSIYLDTGTTALQVARSLPENLALRVFTNNLLVAMELFGRGGVEVTVYGGALATRNPDLVDAQAVANIQLYRLDVAIIGADALDARRGEFYGADLSSALLSRAAQQQAQRVIAVVDSSKFGRRGLVVAGRLQPGFTLITDNEVSRPDREALHRSGATLIFATQS